MTPLAADNVRVGLVGLGTIADIHLQVLAETSRVELAFAADPGPAETPQFRDTVAPRYRDLESALDKHDPSLVVIATPTGTHTDLAITALTRSQARVLTEKPLAHDRDALARLRRVAEADKGLRSRLFVAHHFAFAPDVRWATNLIGDHTDWGPITAITSAFYDPYASKGKQAFESYGTSWLDSGSNQLSMLTRFVDLEALSGSREDDGGASGWHTARYTSQGRVGTARLRTSWLTGSSSKGTTLTLGSSGVDVWLDHTAMTGFAARGSDLLATHGNDGRTPRKLAHYRPLYASLLSDTPDPVLTYDTAAKVTALLHAS